MVILIPPCASLGHDADRIVIGEPDYSAPHLRSARSVTVIRFANGEPRYYSWEPALSSLSAAATEDHSSYIEAAIFDELRKLDGCQKDQDVVMITVALALAGMVKGWGLNEFDVRGRFLDVCDRLADIRGSNKPPWKRPRDFEEKWRNAMRRAEPRAPLDGWNGGFGSQHQSTKQAEDKGELPYGLKIWKEGQPLKGSLGERYFREARNLDISDEVMAVMRFHPKVKCLALGIPQPAILNVMRKGGYGGEIVSIHATFVGPNGEKPDIDPRKQCFGRYSGTGAVIYLGERPGERTVTLEGIENTVAAMNATGLPGFTGGSGAAMKGAEPDTGSDMRTLYVGADHGGGAYAEPLAKRAHKLGYEVRYCPCPPVAGQDWDKCPAAAVRSALLDAPVWEPGPSSYGQRWYDGLSEEEHRRQVLYLLTQKTRAAIDTSPVGDAEQQQHFEYVLQRLFRAGLDDNNVRCVATGAAFARHLEQGGLDEKIEKGRARWEEDGSPVRTRFEDYVHFEAEDEASENWREPEVIDAPLLPVPKFDEAALLPDGLRDFVSDIAYRMCCPIEYPAVSTIAFAGSVIGANCAIRVKQADDWLVVPNLWGAIVGLPSWKKSPPMNAAMQPLDRIIAKAGEKYHEAVEKAAFNAKVNAIVHEAIKKAIEAKIRKALKDDEELEPLKEELRAHLAAAPEEEEPKLRRFKTNDPTIEKIGELLRENPGGVLYTRDELVGILASWDKAGREGDRQFWLEAWNGTGDFNTDRIGRGWIFIPNLCASIFGGMTADKLTAHLEQASDALGNDGLIQRFQMLVYPDLIPWEYRDRVPDSNARKRADHIFERLAAFDAETWGASQKRQGVKFPYFFFDDAAQAVFVAWTTALHERIEAESIR
jgi:hypothetical protein